MYYEFSLVTASGCLIHNLFVLGVTTTVTTYMYFCRSPFCGDSVSVYNGITQYKSLRRKVCHRQSSRTVVALKGRTAYVRFQSDTVKGTGIGFRGCFKAQGTFCEINLKCRYVYTCICGYPTCKTSIPWLNEITQLL